MTQTCRHQPVMLCECSLSVLGENGIIGDNLQLQNGSVFDPVADRFLVYWRSIVGLPSKELPRCISQMHENCDVLTCCRCDGLEFCTHQTATLIRTRCNDDCLCVQKNHSKIQGNCLDAGDTFVSLIVHLLSQ